MRLMVTASVRWNELRLRSVVDVKVGAWQRDEEVVQEGLAIFKRGVPRVINPGWTGICPHDFTM